MQYVFSMTSRMVTIALGCALLLGVLLFLLGMQIGARLTAEPPAQPPMSSASWAAAVEPARPPPTIAMSVYRMVLSSFCRAIIAPEKANKPLVRWLGFQSG